MRAAGKPVDPVTASREATRRGVQADLDDGTPAQAEASARDLHQHATTARISRAGQDIQASAGDDAEPLTSVFRSADRSLHQVEAEAQVIRQHEPDRTPRPGQPQPPARPRPRRAARRRTRTGRSHPMTVYTGGSQTPATRRNGHARQPWEDPAPVRAHLRRIRDQGGTHRAMAMAAGVPPRAVQAFMNGQERIDPATAAALLAITAEDLHQPRLPAGGTRLRLRSLMAMGHGYTRLARAAGTSPADIRRIIHGRAAEVTPQLHDRVRGVWEAWWDKTPPVRTAAEAAAATKARARARRGGWCTPLGLDEDLIDRPGYQPGHGWLPATGTGTAPDQEPCGPGPEPAGR